MCSGVQSGGDSGHRFTGAAEGSGEALSVRVRDGGRSHRGADVSGSSTGTFALTSCLCDSSSGASVADRGSVDLAVRTFRKAQLGARAGDPGNRTAKGGE